MKNGHIFIILIFLLSCKEDALVSSSIFVNTKWDLVDTREAPTCCNFVKDFNWKKYKIDGNILTYEFTANRVTEYTYCPKCPNTTFIKGANYMYEDSLLKIDNLELRICADKGTKILKLTNDTLIVGISYGREGDYSELKLARFK